MDDSAAEYGVTGHCPRREIFRQFAVPRPSRFGHRALSSHPLFDGATPVIALVRFHLSPPLGNKPTMRLIGKERITIHSLWKIYLASRDRPRRRPGLEQLCGTKVTLLSRSRIVEETERLDAR